MSEPKIVDEWESTTKDPETPVQRMRLVDLVDAYEFHFMDDGEWVTTPFLGIAEFPGFVLIHSSVISALSQRIEQLCTEKAKVN